MRYCNKEIILIRHGKTAGNIAGRYIGRTDEPLAARGISELSGRKYPPADRVIASPMLRCVQTAGIIYPELEIITYKDLRECDFGEFENKTYEQLKNNPCYIKWIESEGRALFPDGEAAEVFRKRCCTAFEQAVNENDCASLAFVVHGGVIMAVLERFSAEKKGFYDTQTENGGGFVCKWDGKWLYIKERLFGNG